MSQRRSPIKHKVLPSDPRFSEKVRTKGFTRGIGKRVVRKVKRKKAATRRKTPRSIRNTSGDSGFNVSFFFTNKPRETVNVGENNYTAGVKAGLSAMRTPSVPVRIQIRRRKR